jgi:hypothetical protein
MLPVELCEPICKFSVLPVDRKYQSWHNYIILLINSNINVDGLM